MPIELSQALASLNEKISGELHTDSLARSIYSTDASIYEEMPQAVAIPKNESDLIELVKFANEHKIGITPRAAGTSLAGQVVGAGLIVDISRYFNQIVEVNPEERWVRVQPGVVRNELNLELKQYGLFFGPETSTQNRAMMGGMLGNNSCGANSIRYGCVRDHVLEVDAILADGTSAKFGPMTADAFNEKCSNGNSLESQIYKQARQMFSQPGVRDSIAADFPKSSVMRRNAGYAIDALMHADCFDPDSDQKFNFSKLIAGSEGTLCFTTEMKLNCVPLPPEYSALLAIHFKTVEQAYLATRMVMQSEQQPFVFACELIDQFILQAAARSVQHSGSASFVQGEPGAILAVELRGESQSRVSQLTSQLLEQFKKAGLGYAFPVLNGANAKQVWELRKAGLGLLSNSPSDTKPAPGIEDTAVSVEDLPQYASELTSLLNEQFDVDVVQYAHAGAGEIHFRPLLNLKTEQDRKKLFDICRAVAQLVKKFDGSLSGEHGDGRMRSQFLKKMIGTANYERLIAIKSTWDQNNIMNPGKVLGETNITANLRSNSSDSAAMKLTFDWSKTGGMKRAVEMCNGSGDCRKSHLMGGTMCPSYMATRNEKDTTRARANVLRQALTAGQGTNPFSNQDAKEVLDLCLSCKGCKRECPSTIDMAKMKAEFQQSYFDANGTPLRNRVIANFTRLQKIATFAPRTFNRLANMRWLKKQLGFHCDRRFPKLANRTFAKWFANHKSEPNAHSNNQPSVWLLNDEFTNFVDAEIGVAATELLEGLGYHVELAPIQDSGRSCLSQGLLRKAKSTINDNISKLSALVSEETPLVGLEPSAFLTFLDEAIDLATPENRVAASQIAEHTMSVEAFLVREFDFGRIAADSFVEKEEHILFHGHCFEKAITTTSNTIKALRIPANYQVTEIPSGCCGMAGSFGYESEHFEVSKKIANLVLVPEIQRASESTLVASNGTSCRQQILHFTERTPVHPIQILRQALK